MAGAVPCLGYPSRTAAVTALRRQGLLTREIAERTGLAMNVVSALEASAARQSAAPPTITSGGIRMAKLSDYFESEILVKLRPHAAAREMSVDRLIKTIVETVSADGMVDAVLDDRDR